MKDTQRAIEECSSRYERCYRELPVMLHSIDGDGHIIDVNAEWLRTLGYEHAEVIGRPAVDFLTEESRRYVLEETLPAFFRTGYARDVPYSFVTKDGDVVEVLLSATTERDQHGKFLRSISVAVKTADMEATRGETVS
ncbi:MAG: PAS domain-containing protein [Spirochaetia bacterium]